MSLLLQLIVVLQLTSPIGMMQGLAVIVALGFAAARLPTTESVASAGPMGEFLVQPCALCNVNFVGNLLIHGPVSAL